MENGYEQNTFLSSIPSAILSKIVKTILISVIFIISDIFIIIYGKEINISFIMTSLIIVVALIIYIVYIIRIARYEEYTTLQGECIYTKRTGYRKQNKFAYIEHGNKIYCIPINSKKLGYSKGAILTVYYTNKCQIIERDSVYKITTPFAIDISKAAFDDE